MKITVIIPCFNVRPYIKRALDSVKAQTWEDLQVICVDDGSTDDTISELEKYKKESFHDLVIIQQKNSGATSARNAGIKMATGEYLQFLDADDELLPEKIEVQVRIAQKEGYPEIIAGGYEKKSEDRTTLGIIKYKSGHTVKPLLSLMKSDLGCTCSNLFLTEALRKAGGWSESMKSSQEYEMMFRLVKAGARAVMDPNVNTVVWQRNSGSISSTNKDENRKRFTHLRLEMMQYARQVFSGTDLKEAWQALFDALRVLYPFDSGEAERIFYEMFPADFVPDPSPVTSKNYTRMFRLIGFKNTERLKSITGKIFN